MVVTIMESYPDQWEPNLRVLYLSSKTCFFQRLLSSQTVANASARSIPAHLDAWVILNSETRFSLGLTGMAVLPAPESDKSTRFASLEYSEMVYAEAFMYRSAQPL